MNFTSDGVTFTFIAGNNTGKRFEFFNSSGGTVTIRFAATLTINSQVAGLPGLSFDLAEDQHAVVMGIANDVYIAWISSAVSLS
jgi:hypothetical protein